jgi:predicted nucleic acid-binding protein
MADRQPAPFIDSDVLIYLASADPGKAAKAEGILAGGGVISVQVLNEIANIARRKLHLSWTETHAFLTTVRAFLSVEALTIDAHETALRLAERYQLSTYDAMIVASALNAGCRTLLSKDMQHDQIIEGRLRVLNPFVAA